MAQLNKNDPQVQNLSIVSFAIFNCISSLQIHIIVFSNSNKQSLVMSKLVQLIQLLSIQQQNFRLILVSTFISGQQNKKVLAISSFQENLILTSEYLLQFWVIIDYIPANRGSRNKYLLLKRLWQRQYLKGNNSVNICILHQQVKQHINGKCIYRFIHTFKMLLRSWKEQEIREEMNELKQQISQMKKNEEDINKKLRETSQVIMSLQKDVQSSKKKLTNVNQKVEVLISQRETNDQRFEKIGKEIENQKQSLQKLIEMKFESGIQRFEALLKQSMELHKQSISELKQSFKQQIQRLEKKIQESEMRTQKKLDSRFSYFYQRSQIINKQFEQRIQQRFDRIQARFDRIQARLDKTQESLIIIQKGMISVTEFIEKNTANLSKIKSTIADLQ